MIQFDLKDRVAVVTGGAQGFGLAITQRFIESGAKVVIWDIDESEAKTTANIIGHKILFGTRVILAKSFAPKKPKIKNKTLATSIAPKIP